MKKMILPFAFLLLLLEAQAQKPVTDAKSDSTELKEVKSKLDEVMLLLRKDYADEEQYTGKLCLIKSKQVKIHGWHGKQQIMQESGKSETTEIVRVTILMKDGYVVDINAYAANGEQFTNTRATITISTRRLMQTDSLGSVTKKGRCILLSDILSYQPYKNYAPEDGNYELTSSNPCDSLFRNVGINTVVDMRVYTDALGLFGAESNGLTQTEVKIKQTLHRINLPNTGNYLGHYLKFSANIAKFDSKISFVDSAKFSRAASIQRSWFHAEGAYTLLTTWIERKSMSSLYWDLGAGINAFKIAGNNDTLTAIGQNLFTEFGLNLRSSDNIGFDFTTRTWVNFSPQTRFTATKDANWFVKVGCEVFWNPLNDKAGRLFGKVNYILPVEAIEKRNHFFQVQLGYSVLLSKALKKD